MQHRAPRPSPSARLRPALATGAARLWRTSRPLVLSVALLVVGGLALAVPHRSTADAATLAAHASPADATRQPGDVPDPGRTAADAAPADQPATSPVAEQQDAAVPAAPAEDGNGTDGAAGPPPADPQPAAAANPNCTLVVPPQPLTAAGLATPYQLVATDPGSGACHETDTDQSAFVESAILDPASGAVSIYHPVVVDQGSTPAAAPVPVQLPAGAVVGVWFGFNGDTLTLGGPGAPSCVNGLPGSPFGQFAYCNGSQFFDAANQAIAAGTLSVPPLGTGLDGLPCPTTRDFFVVDQDQSDNLATRYRIVDGKIGQDTAATRAGASLTNGSDEGLLAKAIDPALGCTPFQAPDLTDGGAPTAALALNELSAAANQAGPMALVPTNNPMTQVDGAVSTRKTDLYRAGVDMPALPAGQDPQAYCANMLSIAHSRLAQDASFLRSAPAPSPGPKNLYAFLTARLQGSAGILGC